MILNYKLSLRSTLQMFMFMLCEKIYIILFFSYILIYQS